MALRPEQLARRTATIYAVVSAAWILFSDQAVVWVVSDPRLIARLSTYKGWAFVVVTAALLYVVLLHQLTAWHAETGRRRALEAVDTSALSLGRAELHEAKVSELQAQVAELGASLDDRDAITRLGEHAAIAIENARLRDSLRAAIAARDQVLAVVAHDLRNPLSAVSLQARLLARRHPDDEIGEVARKAQRSIDAMNRLIADLLDAARLDRGELRVEPRPQRLRPLVDEVLDALAPNADDRGVHLRADVAPELAVRADADRLDQVLFNLVGNAIKFTPEGGEIEVRAATVGGAVQVSVADSGSGIPAIDLPHIFERWFTHDGARRGNGLGLYIAKEIVAAHGGRIWVDSGPDRGTRFSFTLPT